MPRRHGLPKGIGLYMSAACQAKDLNYAVSVQMESNGSKSHVAKVLLTRFLEPQMGGMWYSVRSEEEKVSYILLPVREEC